jgi:hypothetical protein
VLAAKNLRFDLALAEICQTFGQQQCQGQEGMTCPKSTTQSLLETAASLIVPIWRG